MREVKVKKDELLTKIKANREKHVKEFLEACEGYRAKMLERVDDAVNKLGKYAEELSARKGTFATDAPSLNLRLDVPVSHEGDYDQVIEMLSMSVDTEITLKTDEFACYVMDKWEWKHSHTTTMSAYGKGG